jgi:hypothetical protein
MATDIGLTTDHDEIRQWVESVGGRPVHVRVAGSHGPVGVPSLELPGRATSGRAVPTDWDDWFGWFDDAGLALLYEKPQPDAGSGPFGKLVPR